MRNSKKIPAELARAGEARHFIAWLGAAAGLRGGALSDLAVAAEALLTDVLLSVEDGNLEVTSEVIGEAVEITVNHPRLARRRMADLEGVLGQFLDAHELTPAKATLVKRRVL